MSFHEWSLIISTIVPLVLAIIPWLMRVHTKLEIVAGELMKFSKQIETNTNIAQDLHQRVSDHAIKLNAHDIRIMHLNERIEKLE